MGWPCLHVAGVALVVGVEVAADAGPVAVDVPAAGVVVVKLSHMAAEFVELWRELKVRIAGRALVVEINDPPCELDKLAGQVHPWFVVVPLVLGVGWGVRGVHTAKLECPVKCRGAIPSTRALKRLRSRMMSAMGRLLIRSLLPSATSTLIGIADLP